MGTTYTMILGDEGGSVKQSSIDSLLLDINLAVSTYIDTSEISRFNQSMSGITTTSEHLIQNIKASRQIFAYSNGYFDPTIMPLINYWGFGYKVKKAVNQVDSTKVAQLKKLVDFKYIELKEEKDSYTITKWNPAVELDFSALAKGYAVDKCLEFVKANGVSNAMVEIGGETHCIGKNKDGNTWKIGINTPSYDAAVTDIQTIIALDNKSIASSGNYRNYYDVDGIKYGHEVNPMTGYPEQTEILSTSIVADECMFADGYATACMLMDTTMALQTINALDGVEALFIVNDEGKYKNVYTPGFEQYIAN